VRFIYNLEGVVMNHVLKLLLLISIAALMTACKLAVIVVEGGEVQSTGAGTCVAGTICVVEVTDPNFSETFTAIPDEGWYFQKWNSGDRFFCGDSSDLACHLSFKGHEDSKAVEDMVASTEVFYIMPVFRELSPIIEVNGKLWAQPGLFVGISWNEIEAVCPAPNGVCSGELNLVDLNGWTWASVKDVNELFNYYIGSDGDELDPMSRVGEFDTKWASAFFGDGWQATNSSDAFRAIFGWTRSKMSLDRAYVGAIIDALVYNPEGNPDAATTERTQPVEEHSEITGSWFYSTP